MTGVSMASGSRQSVRDVVGWNQFPHLSAMLEALEIFSMTSSGMDPAGHVAMQLLQ
jgi:hypothetical protein